MPIETGVWRSNMAAVKEGIRMIQKVFEKLE